MKTAFLLVSCCLEESRADILGHTVASIKEHFGDDSRDIHVFDNASTDANALTLLKKTFRTVHRSDKNVGYWSAISWWLQSMSHSPPQYTYIIESDMIHYDVSKFGECIDVLDKNDDIGSIRLHHYDVENRHLFDKDRPRQDSKRNLWQSHTNKITGNPVKFSQLTKNVWSTTFLTQLPALNRFEPLFDVFKELESLQSFSELDFQRLYWERFKRTGILNGGAFHCDLNAYGSKAVTGSWTDSEKLKTLGYKTTRQASITSSDQYTVTLVL